MAAHIIAGVWHGMNPLTLTRRASVRSASCLNLPEGTRSPIRSLRLASGDGEWAERHVICVSVARNSNAGEDRTCPGRDLADLSVWIVMATILSTLRISKAKDENGQEIMPEIAFDVNFTAYVLIPSLHDEMTQCYLPHQQTQGVQVCDYTSI